MTKASQESISRGCGKRKESGERGRPSGRHTGITAGYSKSTASPADLSRPYGLFADVTSPGMEFNGDSFDRHGLPPFTQNGLRAGMAGAHSSWRRNDVSVATREALR